MNGAEILTHPDCPRPHGSRAWTAFVRLAVFASCGKHGKACEWLAKVEKDSTSHADLASTDDGFSSLELSFAAVLWAEGDASE